MWHRREERGSVVVEFALVLPILMLLLFGIIEFGRGYNAKIQLTSAVREGTRKVALGGTTAEAVTITKDAAPGLNGNSITVTVVESCGVNPPPGSNARVQASYPFGYDIPLFRSATVTLSVTGVMRCGG